MVTAVTGMTAVLVTVLSAPGGAGTEAPPDNPEVAVEVVLVGDCAPENGATLTVENQRTEAVDVRVAGSATGTVAGGSSQRFVVDLFGTIEVSADGAAVPFAETAVCRSSAVSDGTYPLPPPRGPSTPAGTPVAGAPTFTG